MQSFAKHMPIYLVVSILLAANMNSPAGAVSQLKQFDKAPELILPKLAEPTEDVDVQKLGQAAILIFGEPYHQQTVNSLTELKNIYQAAGLTQADLPVFLIFSQVPTQEQLSQLRKESNINAEILLDKSRKTFGDYGVIVLPSIVVMDKQGEIALALSGVPFSFSDIVADSIHFAMGQTTRQQYESAVSAAADANSLQESAKRGRRLSSFAGQLLRRNYTQLALNKYREALELDSTNLQARVGVARCLIKLHLLPDAIEQLQKIVQADADNIDANLIMAQIELSQGGEGLATGKLRLQRILTLNPYHPETNYLMGKACEMQGETERALNYYKKAAEFLIETGKN